MKGVFRNAFNQRSGPAIIHDGHRGEASEPYILDDYESGEEEIICRTIECGCGDVFTAFIGEFFEDRFQTLRNFHYIVTVSAPSKAEADAVINNRINYEEDYGFTYQIDAVSDVRWFADVWDEGYEAGHETARAVNPEYPDQPDNPYRSNDD